MAEKQEWKVAPGGVAKKDNPFLIDATLWNAINVYVYNGVKVPENAPQTDLSGAYALIREHTRKWRDVTFPKSLSVADDIVDYGSKAPRLFAALSDAGDKIMEAADGSFEYEAAKKRFVAILNRLIDDAAKHAANAVEVKDLVLAFRSQTIDDHNSIKTIHKKYDTELGVGSAKEQQVKDEIAQLQAAAAALNDEYNQAVVVAATSPTYAWVFPVGTISAIVVAGVYGDKAVKLKEAIDNVNAKLGTLDAEQKQRAELLALLRLAVNSSAGIEKLMGPACDALDKVAGTWNAIAADLKKLRDFITNMRGGFDLYFVDIPQAIDDWKSLAEKADAYRANAFIKVSELQAAG